MFRRILRLAIPVLIGSAAPLICGTVYSTVPSPLPPNLPSVGFEATSTSEFGNAVRPSAAGLMVDTLTVVMSSWAPRSEHPDYGNEDGFTVPLTLNLYQHGEGGAVGALLLSRTIDAFIAWRPEYVPACNYTGWQAPDGTCWGGKAAPVAFALIDVELVLPDTFIFGIGFNTQHHGYHPIGAAGPYNSLNVGLTSTILAGENLYPGGLYYSDGGTFRLDPAGWGSYATALQITVTPEPATLLLVAPALAGLAGCGRRSKTRGENALKTVDHRLLLHSRQSQRFPQRPQA